MQRFRSVILLFSMFSLLCILQSCGYDPAYHKEAEASAWEDESSPLTETEKEFMDSIAKTGFTVSISHPYTDRRSYSFRYYDIDIINDTISATAKNKQFLTEFREKLVNELCMHVISDSILFNMKEISTNYELRKFDEDRYHARNKTIVQHFNYDTSYLISEKLVELKCRVVMNRDGTYEKISLK